MVSIVAVNDDRFGNNTALVRFGSNYMIWCCEALLLDGIMPNWKDEIFQPHVYLMTY